MIWFNLSSSNCPKDFKGDGMCLSALTTSRIISSLLIFCQGSAILSIMGLLAHVLICPFPGINCPPIIFFLPGDFRSSGWVLQPSVCLWQTLSTCFLLGHPGQPCKDFSYFYSADTKHPGLLLVWLNVSISSALWSSACQSCQWFIVVQGMNISSMICISDVTYHVCQRLHSAHHK